MLDIIPTVEFGEPRILFVHPIRRYTIHLFDKIGYGNGPAMKRSTGLPLKKRLGTRQEFFLKMTTTSSDNAAPRLGAERS